MPNARQDTRPPAVIATVFMALCALVAGLAQACSLADPWTRTPHGWLQIASLAALAGLLARPGMTWRRGFVIAWLFGAAWLAGTFWWLFISMHRYGGLNAALAVLAVLALAGALALYYGVAGALFAGLAGIRGWPRATPAPALLIATLFAALWTLAELARGRWFTGFPWGAGGYAHVDGVLAGYAPWVGVYGIGFLAAWIAAFCGRWVASIASAAINGPIPPQPLFGLRPQKPLQSGWGWRGAWGGANLIAFAICLATIVMAIWLPRRVPMSDHPDRAPITVALLQGNIPQDEKFVPGAGVDLSLNWYGEQFQKSAATLTIAPETAIPLLPDDLPQGYEDALAAHFMADARGDQALLTGMPQGNFAAGYTNAVFGWKPGAARPYRYDKHHLVPFGEFIPPLFKWFVRLMNIPLGDFNRGALAQASFEWRGERFAPTICYEDLFGEELAARFSDPATAPTAFVNASNLGWFGDTVALDQHLAISRMRALEFARPVLSATNTGATAIIDAQGRVTQILPYATRGALTGEFHGETRITPYAWWASRWGLAPVWGVCWVIVAVAWLAGRRRVR